MRRNLSNITKEEASAKIAELNKQRNCPVCGPKRNRVAELSRHSDGIVTFLRDNNFRLEQDSCILCVEKHIADAKGYVLINFFSLLHSEMKKAKSSFDIQTEQEHLKTMAVGCLAFCCCREKQMGKTFSFDRYTDAVRSAYKPHRDTGNSEEQREVLQKKIASLEKEFGKSISLSFTGRRKNT